MRERKLLKVIGRVITQPITVAGVELFWQWVNIGAPTPHRSTRHMRSVSAAALTGDQLLLADLATSNSPWVRFAVVANSETPDWVLWGDGQSSLGLAGDSNGWIAAAVVLRWPQPPARVLRLAAASNPADAQ